ncbi:hypothetical protein PWY87_24280 [Kribbella solani]|uniref:hypothetical protein n=1 Tax=Kribbella solani TaxID=236067 RepID=UPI0029B944FD|nr:hypothetical protein [Kribbella solani]MDX2968164.1 hypothetical protein [Kribbella solani]MDX3004823.1 hypothetical protein [Kribbella solani]
METIVAYAFDRLVDSARVRAGIRRVEAYYGELWGETATRSGSDAGPVGLLSWRRRTPSCNWPAWQEEAGLSVASLHAPLGYESVVGDIAPERAAVPLALAARKAPERLLELAPPFVLCVLDQNAQRLDLYTDSVGLGRMFQLRTADGWVWSNRPAAACLFADVAATPSVSGWRFAAGCGWFMGASMPYEYVSVVPGATHVEVRGRDGRMTVSRIDATSVWSGNTSIPETAAALQGVARSIGRLWPGTPTVDLSGGRDSRVVAAAFLSAGVDVRLNSYGAEAETAKTLVRALPFEVDHAVSTPSNAAASAKAVAPAKVVASAKAAAAVAPVPLPGVIERIRRWHRYGDGLRPSSYLFHQPPSDLAGVDHLAIGGAGGEVAHGHFYPRDVAAIDQLPLHAKIEAFTQRLSSRLVAANGVPAAAREAVETQIRSVLDEAGRSGLQDARMLDYFYVVERLRRWGTTGERSGVVSPLLLPAFSRAAFRLTTSQRLQNALHLELIAQLMPQWTAVPFFKTTSAAPVQVKRLGAAADHEAVRARLDGVGDDAVRALWKRSSEATSSASDEAVLRQLLWQSVFDDHLAEVNRHLSRPVIIQPEVKPGVQPRVRRTTRAWRRVRRNRAARRMARTALWRVLRKYFR